MACLGASEVARSLLESHVTPALGAGAGVATPALRTGVAAMGWLVIAVAAAIVGFVLVAAASASRLGLAVVVRPKPIEGLAVGERLSVRVCDFLGARRFVRG